MIEVGTRMQLYQYSWMNFSFLGRISGSTIGEYIILVRY